MTNTIEEIRNILTENSVKTTGVQGKERDMLSFDTHDRSFYLLNHFSHVKLLVYHREDVAYSKKYMSFDNALIYVEQIINKLQSTA